MSLLLKTHAGKGRSVKSSEAVLSFMSEALRGLSTEFERLIGGVSKIGPPKKAKKPRTKVPAKRKTRAKKKGPAKRAVIPKRKRGQKLTDTAKILQIIKGHKKGVDVSKLKKKTNLADSKVRAIVYRASKEGKIKRVRRGVYISA
jgi:hypothetical protein